MDFLVRIVLTLVLSPFFIAGILFCALSACLFFLGGAVGFAMTSLWNEIWAAPGAPR